MLNWIDHNLWIISVILMGFSIYSFYRGNKQWKSGSTWTTSDGVQHSSKDRVPFFSVGATVFGIILLLAAIGSFIWIQLEK